MSVAKNFLDRFIERVEDVDPGSRQSYILRLLREKGFLETVFNTVEEGIIVIDMQLKIRYVNRAAKQILALPDEISKLPASRLFPSVDWAKLRGDDPQGWAEATRQEIEILYPDHKFLQFYLAPLPEASELAAVFIFDVTSLRRQAIADAEEGANKAVSMLGAEVAHEIGNPLNSLYLNLQMLEEAFSGKIELDEAEKSEITSACRREVERLDNIIRRFLKAVRNEKIVFAPVDLRKLIVDTLNFMKNEIENRNISIKCSWPDEMPAVQGDADSLKQVIYNIIRNAFQAMQSGGSLTISCGATPDYISVEFQDEGTGVNAEQLREIFKPFKTFKKDGHGIGMMIIERICREHGAEFGITSDAKKGTALSIRFPRAGRIRPVLPQ